MRRIKIISSDNFSTFEKELDEFIKSYQDNVRKIHYNTIFLPEGIRESSRLISGGALASQIQLPVGAIDGQIIYSALIEYQDGSVTYGITKWEIERIIQALDSKSTFDSKQELTKKLKHLIGEK